MRLTIVIDDDLLRAAKDATGLKTTRAVVEAGLRKLMRFQHQVGALKALQGAADWEGDLDSMRERE